MSEAHGSLDGHSRGHGDSHGHGHVGGMPIESGLERQIAGTQADPEQNRRQRFPFRAADSQKGSWHTSTSLPDCGVHPKLI